jgi:hypothetical protein
MKYTNPLAKTPTVYSPSDQTTKTKYYNLQKLPMKSFYSFQLIILVSRKAQSLTDKSDVYHNELEMINTLTSRGKHIM